MVKFGLNHREFLNTEGSRTWDFTVSDQRTIILRNLTMDVFFWQLKELQNRQATLLTLQRDAEMCLAEAEEEVSH